MEPIEEILYNRIAADIGRITAKQMKAFERKKKLALRRGKQPPIGIMLPDGTIVCKEEDREKVNKFSIKQAEIIESNKRRVSEAKRNLTEINNLIGKIMSHEVQTSKIHVSVPLPPTPIPFGAIISTPTNLKYASLMGENTDITFAEQQIRDAYIKDSSLTYITKASLEDGTIEAIAALCSLTYSNSFIIAYIYSKDDLEFVRKTVTYLLDQIVAAHTKKSLLRGSTQTISYQYTVTENKRTLFKIYRNNDLRIFELVWFDKMLTKSDVQNQLQKHSIFIANDIIESKGPRAAELSAYSKLHNDEYLMGIRSHLLRE